MPQTGSMLGFIILVVLVVIGVILYSYLTVMNQSRNENKDQREVGSTSKFKLAASLQDFTQEVKADLPSELPLPLGELKSAKAQLIAMTDLSAARVETNLIAECTRCGKRISSREIDNIDWQMCETPNCKSEEYLLRWLPGNGFAQAAPPAGE